MKVLLVITKSNFGGAQRYVYDLAIAADLRGHDVTVVSGGTGLLIEKLSGHRIKTLPVAELGRDVNILKDISAFFVLLRIFKREKPDVVHLNSSKIGGLGALAARLARVPKIIFTAHGWAFNEDRKFLSKVAIKCIAWFTIALSHQTIAVSEQTKSDVSHLPFVGKKIVVIRNGVCPVQYLSRQKARDFLIQRCPALKGDGFWVGTIAELHPIKGLRYAIEAIGRLTEALPNLQYVIVGEGEEREHLRRLVIENHLENKVAFAGFADEAPRYLKAFDAFLLPSLSEALSLAVLEAGMAGVPCIATAVGGLPEIIHSGKNGILIAPRDPGAIGNALHELAKSADMGRAFGEKLKATVETEFSKERMVERTLARYTTSETA